MSDDNRRRGFAADVARQARGLSLDALRVLDRVARRLAMRQEAFGPLDLAKLGDWQRWRGRPDERVDEALLTVAEEIAAEDREQEEQRERARDEVVPRPTCTGLTARWCPRCGDCTCDRGENAELNDPGCPLHAPTSPHAEPNLHIGAPGDLLTGKPIVVEPGTDQVHRCRAIRVVVDESAEPDELGGGG